MNKAWYRSLTLWANALALIAIIVQLATGQEWLDAEAQAAIITAINFLLRIKTNKPLTLHRS